jgi:hypothetical protein
MTLSNPSRRPRLSASGLAVLMLTGVFGTAGAQTLEPAAGPAETPAPGPSQLDAPVRMEVQESSPWYLGINQSFTRESNVLRASTSGTLPVVSDSYSLTSLLAGFDQSFGRQRVFGNAAVRTQKYSTNDQLDNTGYGVTVGLDWSTIERLSGRLSATANRTAVSPGDSPGLPANTEDSAQVEALFRLGIVTRLAFEAEFISRKVDYSLAQFASREFKQDSASLGLRYRFSDFLNVGLGVRKTKAKYPRFSVSPTTGADIADELDRNDVDLRAEWTPSPITALAARISVGKSEYLQNTSRDYSGTTGYLTWTWRPTAKLNFATTASRESGQETSVIPGVTTTGTSTGTGTGAGTADPTSARNSDTSRVTNSLGITSTFAATAKINLTAAARVDRRTLIESLLPGGGAVTSQSGSDTTQTLSVGFSWMPTRSLSLGCNVGRESRSTDSALSSEYSSNVAGCFGQFMLR